MKFGMFSLNFVTFEFVEAKGLNDKHSLDCQKLCETCDLAGKNSRTFVKKKQEGLFFASFSCV